MSGVAGAVLLRFVRIDLAPAVSPRAHCVVHGRKIPHLDFGRWAFWLRVRERLDWYGGPGVYVLMRHDYMLALQAVVSGEGNGVDTINGVATSDTAMTSVYLGPQINFTWSDRQSAHLAGDLPVSIVSSGEQIVPDYRVRAAVTWRF